MAGRESSYVARYAEQAYKLCLLGATDRELADFFQVHTDTINEWKNVHEEFSVSITRGKISADAEVAEKMFHRAKGYSHPDVHISSYEGKITITDITKHYPPDTPAASLWLRNRQPGKWRDKQEHEHTGANGKDLIPDRAAAEARVIALLMKTGMSEAEARLAMDETEG